MEITRGFALAPNGSVRAFDEGAPLAAGEVAFLGWPSEEEKEIAFPALVSANFNASIKAQIVELESLQTARRIRQAVLGTDGGWLAGIEAQIVALRASLIPGA